MRPQSPVPGDVTACELGDQQRGRPGVDAEDLVDGVAACTGVWARPKRSVAAGTKVSATQPDALLTRICTGPSSASAASKRAGMIDGVGEVGLHRRRPGRRPPGSTRPRSRPGPCGWPDRRPAATGPRGRPARSLRKYVHRTADALRGQRLGRRRADPVVGTGDERNLAFGERVRRPSPPWCRHSRRCAAPPGSLSAAPERRSRTASASATNRLHELARRHELGDRPHALAGRVALLVDVDAVGEGVTAEVHGPARRRRRRAARGTS